MLRFDVRTLMRAVRGQSGAQGDWQWPLRNGRRSQVGFSMQRGQDWSWPPESDGERTGVLTLRYLQAGEAMAEFPIKLEATAPGFGGLRWWARCPGCDLRVAVLWGAPFQCRVCHRLQYRSAQVLKRKRPEIAAWTLWAKLGSPQGWDIGNVPKKPRWMRWRTYDRLARAIAEAAEREVCLEPLDRRALAMHFLEDKDQSPDTPRAYRRRRRLAASRARVSAEQTAGPPDP